MKFKPNYIKTTDAIQGYKDSVIAKKEKNDCVVRAIASSFDIPYDNSHSFVESWLGRKPFKGTFNTVEKLKRLQKDNFRLNEKSLSLVEGIYLRKEGKSNRKLTVGRFLEKYNQGTYIIFVHCHAFTIKDGSIIGNADDATKLRRIVHSVFVITP